MTVTPAANDAAQLQCIRLNGLSRFGQRQAGRCHKL